MWAQSSWKLLLFSFWFKRRESTYYQGRAAIKAVGKYFPQWFNGWSEERICMIIRIKVKETDSSSDEAYGKLKVIVWMKK